MLWLPQGNPVIPGAMLGWLALTVPGGDLQGPFNGVSP